MITAHKYIPFHGELAKPQEAIDAVIDMYKGAEYKKQTNFTPYKMHFSPYKKVRVDPNMNVNFKRFKEKHIDPDMDVYEVDAIHKFRRVKDIYNPQNSLLGLPNLKIKNTDNINYYQFNLKGKTDKDIIKSALIESGGGQTDLTQRKLNETTGVELTDKRSLAEASKHENFAEFYKHNKTMDKAIKNTIELPETFASDDFKTGLTNHIEDKKIYKKPKSIANKIPVEPIIPPSGEETEKVKEKKQAVNEILKEGFEAVKAEKKYEKNLKRKEKKKSKEVVEARKNEIEAYKTEKDTIEKEAKELLETVRKNNPTKSLGKRLKPKRTPPEGNVESVAKEVERIEAETAVVPHKSTEPEKLVLGDIILTPEGAEHLLEIIDNLRASKNRKFGERSRLETVIKHAKGDDKVIKLAQEYMKSFATIGKLKKFVASSKK